MTLSREDRAERYRHLRANGICTRCKRHETERFALCIRCRQSQAKAQRARMKRRKEAA